jgi:kynurenine formamidase
MTVFPGAAPPAALPIRTIQEHGHNERRLALTTHTGTHLDAPAHLIEGADTLDKLDAGRFAGSAVVIDVRDTGPEIGVEVLKARRADPAGCDYLLLRTGWDEKWKTDEYLKGFPALSAEAAAWLARRGFKGLGVDCISVDLIDSTELPVHRALLGAGMVIVENLKNLAELPAAGAVFVCAPLPIRDADGSPVRAIALVED